jgi:hypothetical protein
MDFIVILNQNLNCFKVFICPLALRSTFVLISIILTFYFLNVFKMKMLLLFKNNSFLFRCELCF